MSRIDFVDARVGIHSIQQFALAVPDLAEEERFLNAFGLRVTRREGKAPALELRADGSDHLWAQVFSGPRKKLAYVSLGCYAQDFEALAAQAKEAGGRPAQAHPQGPAGGAWFLDPDGNLIQIVVAAKTMPDDKSPMGDLNVPSNTRGAPARSAARRTKPTRLSHMALFTADVSRAVDFYTRGLGLRLADRSGDLIAFTYGRHGSDHHMLAFLPGGGGGLHHSCWDVPSVEDVGLGNTQMRAAGYTRHWGPGRHVLGSNYFNYVRDAFGSWWEFSCHIDYIGKDVAWAVADFADEDSLYLWGPDVPREFTDNVEAVA